MSKLIFVISAVLLMTLAGCASAPKTASAPAAAVASADLPEILPYDDEPLEMLPEVSPVVDEVAP